MRVYFHFKRSRFSVSRGSRRGESEIARTVAMDHRNDVAQPSVVGVWMVVKKLHPGRLTWKLQITHFWKENQSYGVCNHPEKKIGVLFRKPGRISYGLLKNSAWLTHHGWTSESCTVTATHRKYFFMRALKYLSKPCASKGCIWHSLAYTRYGRGRWGQSFIITTYDIFFWTNIIHARAW